MYAKFKAVHYGKVENSICIEELYTPFIVFSSALYPARSRVGRGNIRHFVPHFPPNFSRHCVLSGNTQRRAYASIEIIIYSLEWESNPQPPHFSHTPVPLGLDGVDSFYSITIIRIFFEVPLHYDNTNFEN